VSDIIVNLIDGEQINVAVADAQPINVAIAPDDPILVVTAAEQGLPGLGVPVGGQAGYRLTKVTNADFDTVWAPPGSLAGNDKDVQFNDAGAPGADDAFQWDKNTKTLRIGITDPAPLPTNPLAMVGAVDSYLQCAIKNTSETTDASSDFVATADNGDDENFYIDMGINSSVYDNPDYSATAANDGYITVAGGDLALMTDKNMVKVVVGGTMAANVVAEFHATELVLPAGYQMTNRPEVFYGTGAPPSAVGLADGTLYFKYEV
jgi:hypothetical protein